MRIILGDDDPFSRRTLVELASKWGYDVVAASEGPEVWSLLENQDAACIALLSARLPQVSGLDVFRRLQERPAGKKVHRIAIATQVTRDEVWRALDTCADDYVMKPVTPQELRVRLRLAERILNLQESAEKQAARDMLTGAYTRNAALEVLEHELERGRRQRSPVTVLLIGIDHYERMLKNYGAGVRKTLLPVAAERLQHGLRSYDVISYYDEGEFLIVLPGCDTAPAQTQAQRLCKVLADQPVEVSHAPVFLTCSIGIAGADGTREEHADFLLSRAQQMLDRARSEGGNAVRTLAAVD